MAVPHLLKATLHWKGFGEEGTISWHFKGNAASHSPSELSDAAGNIAHWWQVTTTPSSATKFQALLVHAQTMDLITLYEYDVSGGPATALGTHSMSGWDGTATTLRAPLQTCLVATLRTGSAGASHRGRQYFPASTLILDETSGLLGNASADQVAACAAGMGGEAAGAIAESLSISTLEWGVYSPKLDVCTHITGVTVDNKDDTQRRRAAQLVPTYTRSVTA